MGFIVLKYWLLSDPIKDLGVKEEDVAKIFFLSCQPIHVRLE
jgi:hypothetical protein